MRFYCFDNITIQMLSTFSGMLSRFKGNKIVQNIKDNYIKIKKEINKKIQIQEIVPNIFHISYPEEQTLKEFKQHIADHDFQIWNISQYKYSTALEQKILEKSQNGEIHHLCYEYYSNLPLYELIIAINSIHFFLSLSDTHRVYIHCQDNKIRSSVFLICFIYKFKSLNLQEVSEAIFYINQKLKVHVEVQEQKDSETANYNNFHTFFKNFINYVSNPEMINKKKLELLKIMISDAPKLKLTEQTIAGGAPIKELKVLVEIRCKDQLIQKANFNSTVFEGDSMCIDLSHRTIILGDDFLAIIKYVYKGNVYSMMRIQLNTNFVFQKFFRAHQQYIDLSSYCLTKKETSMFIDFIFEQNLELSDLAKIQSIPHSQALKVHKKHQIRATPVQEVKNQQKKEAVEASPDSFSLHDQEEEEDLDDYLSKLESQA